jgi:hypothetical protein
MKRRRSVFKTVVAPIVVVVAFIPTLAISVWKVLHGRGAESYSNVYGLTIHYTSVLILAAAVILILGVALSRADGPPSALWHGDRDSRTDAIY